MIPVISPLGLIVHFDVDEATGAEKPCNICNEYPEPLIAKETVADPEGKDGASKSSDNDGISLDFFLKGHSHLYICVKNLVDKLKLSFHDWLLVVKNLPMIIEEIGHSSKLF